ncbi:MAG: hypothetical protein J1F63_04560 [Oscillospiraceae bacterium]|nr:hypothetical protein [Oscillospiraceae bacterium]
MSSSVYSDWDYINNNCVELFSISLDRERMESSDMYIDAKTGQPFILNSHMVHLMGGAYTTHFDGYPVSFAELRQTAIKISGHLYDKYKNINESNWKEYIKDRS